MKFLSFLPAFLALPAVSSAAYILTNGNFASNNTTGWTTTGTVSATSGAAVLSAGASILQDFSNGAGTATAENYDFQLDFTFQVSASNQNQRIRIRDNSNANDIITLRLNSGTGVQAFSGLASGSLGWQSALAFTVANNTNYFFRVTGVDLDLSSRSFTVGLSSDGINYTTSSALTWFHSAAVGSDFETIVFESGASTTLTVDNVTVVPEPGSAALAALATLGLVRRRRTR